MSKVKVNFDRIKGKIKAMHATGQPPFTGGFLTLNFSHTELLQKANVPYSRLHDVGGAFGGNRFVDIPNIFRDFDADENDPDSYDFAFTDELIKAMYQYGIKPVFRLGVTIENQAHIRAYRIHPPKDNAKWARICEHIVRHYNEGWANGFYFGIEYWEIWNEPENGLKGKNQMWTGTARQYYEMYDVTSKHLKKCFGNSIKVGGYGACGFYGIYYHPEKYNVNVPKREPDERYEKDTYRVEFLYGFFEYISIHNSPIDFFTWHSYADVEKTVVMSAFLDTVLEKYGYTGLETHLNEWNNAHELSLMGSSKASAAVTAMMCAMHKTNTDMLFYYDSRINTASSYCGMFNAYTRQPVSVYYAISAFGELYALGNETECDCDGVYAISAADGNKKAVLVTNYSDSETTVSTNLDNSFKVYTIGENKFMKDEGFAASELVLEANETAIIKNY